MLQNLGWLELWTKSQIWCSRLVPGTPKCPSFISDLRSELFQMLPCHSGERKYDVPVLLLQETGSCYVRALRKRAPATERKKGRWGILR